MKRKIGRGASIEEVEYLEDCGSVSRSATENQSVESLFFRFPMANVLRVADPRSAA